MSLTMAMKKMALLTLIVSLLVSCSNREKGPDVSGINVTLAVNRFDEAFFGIDTTNIDKMIQVLNRSYPEFLQPFLQTIVGVNDAMGIKTFFRLHKPIFDSAQKKYKDIGPVKKDLENAFRHVKFYFPSYKLPAQIIPVVGPMNSIDDMAKMTNGDYIPDFIGPDFLGISLQFYLGKDFSFYKADYFISNVAPLYRRRRFDREYIVA